MFLKDMSHDYLSAAELMYVRIHELTAELHRTRDPAARRLLKSRIRMLYEMRCEALELSELTEKYYFRGYRIDAKYTL